MKAIILLCLAAFFLLTAENTTAQILNPKKLLERKANKVIEKKTDQALDSVFNKKENPEVKKEEQEESQEVPVIENDTELKPAPDSVPSLQAYSKFDFIPGEKVIFFDDFSQDNVGDFPALWNTNGSAEIVTTNLFPGRWMKFITQESIWTDALLKLPDNYTIEFDVIPIMGDNEAMPGYVARLIQSINVKTYDYGAVPGKAGLLLFCDYAGRTSYRAYTNDKGDENLDFSGAKDGPQYYQVINQKYHMCIWMQKSRVRIYQNQTKLFDLPKAFPDETTKMDRIRFEEGAAMISNIRIAVGAPDMRSKLITEGKLISYGIYFDVNKDVVKPESYGTLKEIAAVLTENPAVKIKIVGHTDADGADAANLDLSKRRAVSVRNELVQLFGIDGARIETDGKGETQAVAPNDTPSNKALNRRVEFIKL